ncbi:MAG: hypothetical protein WCD26_14325, partial [Pseudolabrys sp.]
RFKWAFQTACRAATPRPQFVMDRNIRCRVQEHQNNQWMKIIVIPHCGFLLRRVESISFC